MKTGAENVYLGYKVNPKETGGAGSKNVIIGPNAGPTTGEPNGKLFIHNANSDEPLIWGDFAAREFRLYAEKVSLYKGVTPVVQAAAITSPAAELAALKTAVDALRVAVKGVGITA
jgi:hypothetical protein